MYQSSIALTTLIKKKEKIFRITVAVRKVHLYINNWAACKSGWPSGLGRCVQVAVSPGGVGLNPTSDITFALTSPARYQ